MLEDVSENYWGIAGIGLMIGFPLLVILLGQLAYSLRRAGYDRLLTPLDLFRNTTLFLIFMSLLLRVMVGLKSDHLAVRVVDTALWITLINLALATFNVMFFAGSEGSWRAQVPKLLVDLCRVFIVLLCAAFVVSQIWDIDLKALLAALGVGSLVIGLALQDTLGNLFSGIAVVSGRQLSKGDWIRIGDIEGQVRSINWRTTTVATSSGDLIVIPNGQIARERVRNYGADKRWNGIFIEFKIPHSQPPQPVLDLIVSTAQRTSGVLDEPKPLARILAFDGPNVQYRAILYIRDFAKAGLARTEFLANFWYAARRAGMDLSEMIEIGGAAIDRHRSETSQLDVLEQLSAVKLFQSSPQHATRLAQKGRVEIYRKGEMLLRTGEPSGRLFVVVSGRAAAYFKTEEENTLVEEFTVGDIILFKSSFRHGPVPFDIVATEDVTALALPVAGFEELLTSDRALAGEVERLLTLRDDTAARATAKLLPDLQNGKAGSSHVDILKAMFR